MDSYVASLPDARASARPEVVLQLGQLVRLMRRHLWLIAACAVVAGVAAFVYAHTLPKVYTANGLMTVEGEHFDLPVLEGALSSGSGPDPMPFVHTEVQALTSRAMVAEVVRQLHLDADPEFNADLRPKTLVKKIKDAIGAAMESFLPKQHGKGAAPTEDAVIGAASKALSVFQDNRSLVISISFASQDPELSSKFVNLLIADYISARASYRAEANAGANSVLEHRVDQARKDLEAVEAQMQQMRSQGDVIGLRAGSIGQQQVEELTTAAARAAVERSQLEVSYDRAAAAARQGSADALASVINSPTVSQLRDQEADAARKLAELSAHFGANYPGMRGAQAQYASTQKALHDEAARIVNSLGAQLRVARDQEADVRRQLDAARAGAVQAENERAKLDQLQQEATTRRALYQSLLEQSQRTLAQPATSATPDVRLLSPAVPPGFPSGPHVMLAGALGGCGGALLGCLLALTRLHSVRVFETEGDVTAATGLPVLATLPRRLVRRDHGILATRSGRQRAHEVDIEAMRAVRHRLRYAGRNGVPRCVLLVPVGADDRGKPAAPLAAPVAVSLARVAAADGERVLLIEGDLQTPRIGAQLGLTPGRDDGAAGLAAVMAGADWRDTVTADRQPGLDLLLSHGRAANGHAMLNSVQFQNLLVEARAAYDLVVLHAAPALTADAALLLQRADAAALVIDARLDPAVSQDAAGRLGTFGRIPMAAILVAKA